MDTLPRFEVVCVIEYHLFALQIECVLIPSKGVADG